MTVVNWQSLLRATKAAVRDCAVLMETQSDSLHQALRTMPMDEGLRARALESSVGLKDTAGRVMFELALLQAQLAKSPADAGEVVRVLSGLEATMMSALASFTDLVDQLEHAAEGDEQNERAFVIAIEAAGVMLQSLEKAKAATQELSEAVLGA